MRDLKNPKWIIAKGVLFLALGLVASFVLLVETPRIKSFVLLAVIVWAFCRFYYFAFYVLENYVDADFRYDGLISLIRHAIRAYRTRG